MKSSSRVEFGIKKIVLISFYSKSYSGLKFSNISLLCVGLITFSVISEYLSRSKIKIAVYD